MEVDQITSLVSIFSFGQHMGLLPGAEASQQKQQQGKKGNKKERKEEDDESDSDSDTSSDSGHSSDDPDAEKKPVEEGGTLSELPCSLACQDQELEATTAPAMAAAV